MTFRTRPCKKFHITLVKEEHGQVTEVGTTWVVDGNQLQRKREEVSSCKDFARQKLFEITEDEYARKIDIKVKKKVS